MIKPGMKFYVGRYSVKVGTVLAVNEAQEIAILRLGKWYDWPWTTKEAYTFKELYQSVRLK